MSSHARVADSLNLSLDFSNGSHSNDGVDNDEVADAGDDEEMAQNKFAIVSLLFYPPLPWPNYDSLVKYKKRLLLIWNGHHHQPYFAHPTFSSLAKCSFKPMLLNCKLSIILPIPTHSLRDSSILVDSSRLGPGFFKIIYPTSFDQQKRATDSISFLN